MGLTNDEKKSAIAAARGPLDHEHYAAQLDLKVAKADGDETLIESASARLARVNSKLAVLSEEEKGL